MKKIFGVFGIVLILMITALVTPTIGTGFDEEDFEDLEIKWKILIVIGNIGICLKEKVISGFVLIGYTVGETLTNELINIKFEGLPIFIFSGLFFAFCFYKPVDVSI